MVMSPRMKVASVAELERDWTIDDVAAAHEWLDELERVEAEMHEEARKQ